MPRSPLYNLKKYLLIYSLLYCCLFFPSKVFSADIQAVLDTADGSSGLVVQDSTNAARMRVLSNGNVGINTVTPVGTLEVIKSGTIAPVMVSSSPAARGDYLSVTAAGNVGIGTVGASSKLQVNTGVDQNLRVRPGTDFSSSNGVALQSVNDAGSTTQQLTVRSSDLLLDLTGNIGVGTTTPQSSLVVTNGNVGIGTWSATQALDVSGTVKSTSVSTTLINNSGSYTQSGSSANTLTGPTISTNNIGVGTTTPQGRLTVISGNVGIGTWSPQQALEVFGTVKATVFSGSGAGLSGVAAAPAGGINAVQYSDGVNTAGTEAQFSFNGTNVGIGTTNGAAKLDVRGGVYASGNVGVGSLTPGAAVDVNGTVRATAFVGDGSALSGLSSAAGFTDSGTYVHLTTAADNLGIGTSDASNGKLIITGGNLGVGTTVPGTAIDVNGTVRATSFVGSGVGLTGVLAFPAGGLNAVQYGDGLSTLGDETKFSFNGANVGIGTTEGRAMLDVRGGVYATGNVGLGTTTPQGSLVVTNGNVGIGTWTAAGGGLIVKVGNVGVGTSWPGTAVDVNGTVRATAFSGDGSGLTGLSSAGGFTDGGVNVHLTTGSDNLGIGTSDASQGKLIVTGGNMGIGTTTPAGALAVMNGNVGIGTWVPGAPLSVVGNVQASGQYGASGSTYYFNPNSGNFNISTGYMNYIYGADSVLRIRFGSGYTAFPTSAGNIGIGTLTPQGGFVITNGNVGIGTWTAANASLETTGLRLIGNGAAAGSVLVSSSTGIGTWMAPGTISASVTPGGSSSQLQYNSGGSFAGIVNSNVTASGNIGLGTSLSANTLDVQGGVGIGTLYAGYQAAPSNGLLVQGNVGVGSTAPGVAVDVSGTVRSTAVSTGTVTATGGYTQSGSGVNTLTGLTSIANNVGIGTTTPQTGLAVTNGNVGIGTWTADNGALIVKRGNVGVGTIVPGAAVDVNGTVRATSFVGSGVGLTGVLAFPAGGLNAVQYGDGLSTLGDETKFSFNGTNVGIGTTEGRAMLDVRGGVYATGNVGLGTITPQGSLVVTNGNVGIGTWTAAGGGLIVKVGNVGVGTSWPGTAVDVNGTVRSTAVSTGAVIATGGYTQSGTSVNTLTGQTIYTDNIGVGTTTPQGRLTVISGNVGVGTWSPQQALEVIGTVKATAFSGSGAGLTGVSASPAGGINAVQYSNGTNTVGLETEFSFNGTNVGIGTTNGAAKLDVRGGVYASGNVGVGSTAPGVAVDVSGTVRSTAVSTGTVTATGGYTQSGSGVNTLTGLTSIANNVGIGTTTPQAGLAVTNGNVGIGTWAPLAKLQINGGTQNVYIDSYGNVGIGSVNPPTTFSIGSAVASNIFLPFLVSVGGTYTGSTSRTGAEFDAFFNPGAAVSLNQFSVSAFSGLSGGSSSNASSNAAFVGRVGNYSPNTLRYGKTFFAQNCLNSGGGVVDNCFGFYSEDITTGTNNYGFYSAVSSGSNKYGFYAAGTADNYFGGKVGISTTTPQAGLAVLGNVGIGTWTAAGGALIVKTGNVGVGTSWPGTAVDVNGTVRATSFVGNGTGITGVLAFPAGGLNAVQYGDGLSTLGDETKFSFNGTNIGIGTTNGVAKLDVRGGVYATGNVGVGTTIPGSALSVLGGASFGTYAVNAAPDGGIITSGSIGIGTVSNTAGYELDIKGLAGGNGDIRIASADGKTVLINSLTGTSSATIMSSNNLSLQPTTGNVGIGTTLPSSLLELGLQKFNVLSTGNVGIGTITPQTSLAITTGNVGIGTWTAAGGGLIVKVGNVGVGTSWPGTAVDVNGTVRATNFVGNGTGITGVLAFPAGGLNAVQYGDGLSTLGDEAKLSFNGTNVGIGTTNGVAMLDVRGNVSTTGNVGIGTSTPQGGLAVMNGNVGIGTWSPSKALDIMGSLKVSGDSNSVAFWFPGNYAIRTGFASSSVYLDLGNAYIRNGDATNNATLRVAGSLSVGNTYYTTVASTSSLLVEGNVGVGTIGPGSKLSIVGGVGIGTGPNTSYVTASAPSGGVIVQGNVGIGTWTAAGGNLIVNGGGNVGVGTAWPGTAVDVNGTVRATNFVGSGAGITGVTALPAGGLNAVQYTNGAVTLGDESKLSFNGANVGIGTTNGVAMLDVRGNVSTTGNVGIGTSTPQGGLAVMNGNVGIGTWAPSASLQIYSPGSVGSQTTVLALSSTSTRPLLQFSEDTNAVLSSGMSIEYDGRLSGVDNKLNVNNITGLPVFTVTSGGNVGIGTITPQTALAVTTGNVGIGTWTAAGGGLIVKVGNVGVGTSWPGTAVDVNGTVRATLFVGSGAGITGVTAVPAGGLNAIQYTNGTVTLGDESKLSFNGTNVGINTTNGVAALDINTGNMLVRAGNVGVGTITPQGAFVVTNGNVGIGTWAPNASLSVAGTSSFLPTATTDITAGGGITVTRTIMRIQGSGGAVTITANPEIVAGVDGQVVVLQGVSDANTVKLTNGTGVKLSGGVSFTMGNGDSMTLMYDAANGVWTEVSRSAN